MSVDITNPSQSPHTHDLQSTVVNSITSTGSIRPQFNNNLHQSTVLEIGLIMGITIPLAIIVLIILAALSIVWYRTNNKSHHSTQTAPHNSTGTGKDECMEQ